MLRFIARFKPICCNGGPFASTVCFSLLVLAESGPSLLQTMQQTRFSDWEAAECLPRPSVSLQDAPERKPWRRRSLAEVDELEVFTGVDSCWKATRVCLASAASASPNRAVVTFHNQSPLPVRCALPGAPLQRWHSSAASPCSAECCGSISRGRRCPTQCCKRVATFSTIPGEHGTFPSLLAGQPQHPLPRSARRREHHVWIARCLSTGRRMCIGGAMAAAARQHGNFFISTPPLLPWSESTHHFFPWQLRQEAGALLLCWNRLSSTAVNLGALDAMLVRRSLRLRLGY